MVAWLGLRGVTIVETSFEETLTNRIDLGTTMSIGDAAQRAGFDPLVPAALGDPDAVFVESGRIWMLYASGPDLPETSVPGIGAVTAQFPTGDTPGFLKSVAADGSQLIEFDGLFGIWIEGLHELILSSPEGGAGLGRSAGSTLLWETDTLTLRLEVALPSRWRLRSHPHSSRRTVWPRPVYSGQTIERSHMRRPVILAILIISVLAIALPVAAGGGGGCHGEFSDTSTTSVEVVQSCFRSDVARIEVGDTVTWTNSDSYGHNIFSRQFAGTSNLDWARAIRIPSTRQACFPTCARFIQA